MSRVRRRNGGLGPADSTVDSRGQDEDKSDYYDESNADGSAMLEETYTEAQLLPCDTEKKHILMMFDSMRKDSFFCDVAFLCQGIMFRAHRVIVSSWSRWLRALLCESPDEEVVAFDFFEPDAFGAVLDYMYGVPLTVNVENAEGIIKVVRRLEMQKLEQQCWRFLMTIIDPETNCEKLHELADRFDCPPLKLAAWRILQETRPGYGSSPNASKLLKGGAASHAQQQAVKRILGVTGLTGPGEPGFSSMVTLSKAEEEFPPGGGEGDGNNHAGVHEDGDGMQKRSSQLGPFLSVFDDGASDQEEDEDEGGDDNSEVASDDEHGVLYRKRGVKRKGHGKEPAYSDPDQLDASATAADVIKAWSSRLKRVYEACTAEAEAAEYQDADDFKFPQHSSHVRLHTGTHRRGDTHRERAALLGGDGTGGGAASAGGSTAGVAGLGGPPPPRGRRPAPAAPPTRAGAGAGAGAGVSVGLDQLPLPLPTDGSKHSVDWKEELRRFYMSVGLRDKIPGIAKVLELWKGREEQMLSSLLDKYQDSMPPAMAEHLEQLCALLETHTESSFVNRVGGGRGGGAGAGTGGSARRGGGSTPPRARPGPGPGALRRNASQQSTGSASPATRGTKSPRALI